MMHSRNTVSSVIDAVQGLLCRPEAWCCGAFARDRFGYEVEPTSRLAVSWSISGAIERVIEPAGVREDGDDAEYAEWKRRTELEVETYHALGIGTEPVDGGLCRYDMTLLALRYARHRLAA